MKIPNIKIGKSQFERKPFDLSHDVHTTAQIGECQPVMFQEMIPNSTINLKVSQFTRLAPMPCPTFGRVSTRYYHQFVKYSDIYHPFETMMTDEVYYGSDVSYRPNRVPSLSVATLTKLVISSGFYYTVYVNDISTGLATPNVPSYLLTSQKVFDEYAETTRSLCPKLLLIDGDPRQPQYSAAEQKVVFGDLVTLDNADFILQNSSGSAFVCIKLKNVARRLRKILLGLGYQLNLRDTTDVSILPIFAFFKTWFDVFAPQRYITWKGTNAHSFMEYLEQHAIYYDDTNTWDVNCTDRFTAFWNDLKNCYFVDNQDWIGSHTSSVSTIPAGFPQYSFVDNNSSVGLTGVPQNGLPYANGVELTGLKVDIVKRLESYVNKHTVLGGKVSALLKALYGADYQESDESDYIGSNVFDVQISDVMVTSDTEGIAGDGTGAQVGEYSGKGVGYGEGNSLKFTSKTYGCWITLMTVVPKSNYYQGIDPTLFHNKKYDFYCSDFDSLGMQATRLNNVMGTCSVYDGSTNVPYASTFGFTPRYAEMKVKSNIQNGDFTLRSTVTSYEPYALDRKISENDVEIGEEIIDSSYGYMTYKDVSFVNNTNSLPIANEKWRTVGLYEWLGNYNRIFYNQNDQNEVDVRTEESLVGPMLNFDDNFMVHTNLDVTYVAPMLSLADSFRTDSTDKHTIDVEKS